VLSETGLALSYETEFPLKPPHAVSRISLESHRFCNRNRLLHITIRYDSLTEDNMVDYQNTVNDNNLAFCEGGRYDFDELLWTVEDQVDPAVKFAKNKVSLDN
jgi:hypothetical protein